MNKLTVLLLLFISACAMQIKETSILVDSSCNLPCWNDIAVGQTTKDEILQIIKSSADVDQKNIQIYDHSSQIFDEKISFSFSQSGFLNQQPDVRFESYISHNIVDQLTICGELSTRIGDIVEQIGEPESIITGDNLAGSRNVILINATQGVSYWYTTDKTSGEAQYEIDPEVEIDCLNMFAPAIFRQLMDIGVFSAGHYNAEETQKVMYPWDGYGNLDEKYPPRQP